VGRVSQSFSLVQEGRRAPFSGHPNSEIIGHIATIEGFPSKRGLERVDPRCHREIYARDELPMKILIDVVPYTEVLLRRGCTQTSEIHLQWKAGPKHSLHSFRKLVDHEIVH
jgi:hypothetical protein